MISPWHEEAGHVTCRMVTGQLRQQDRVNHLRRSPGGDIAPEELLMC